MKIRGLLGLICCLFAVISVSAQEDTADSIVAPQISLLTARAGSEIYQLEGHSALRIQDPKRGDYVVIGAFSIFLHQILSIALLKAKQTIWQELLTHGVSLKCIVERGVSWSSKHLIFRLMRP